VASPLFTSTRNSKSPELLVQNDIRALLTAYHRGDTLVVAADKTPGIFELALEMVKESKKLEIRFPKQWRSIKVKIHLVECKLDTTEIGKLRATGKFPSNWEGTLETYLFKIIKEAFEASGCEVVVGLPSRYERAWVI